MTVKIIQRGPERYRRTCEECACIFTYDSRDTRISNDGYLAIDCPQCKSPIRHTEADAI